MIRLFRPSIISFTMSGFDPTLKSLLEPSTGRHIPWIFMEFSWTLSSYLLVSILFAFLMFLKSIIVKLIFCRNLLFLMTLLLCSKTLSILNEFVVQKNGVPYKLKHILMNLETSRTDQLSIGSW